MSGGRNTYFGYHISESTAFLFVPLFLSSQPAEEMGYFSRPDLRNLIGNAGSLLLFYINYCRLIPVIYFQQQHVLYLSCILLAFIMIGTLPFLFTGSILWQYAPVPESENEFSGQLSMDLA